MKRRGQVELERGAAGWKRGGSDGLDGLVSREEQGCGLLDWGNSYTSSKVEKHATGVKSACPEWNLGEETIIGGMNKNN